MERIAATLDEEIMLVATVADLTHLLQQYPEGQHALYTADVPQQLIEGVRRYTGVDDPVTTFNPGLGRVSVETRQRQRAVQALECMNSGGFVLRIFNRYNTIET